MCSGVIAEGDGQGLRGEIGVSCALLLGVIVPDGDDDRRMRRMHLRAVEQVTAQIDHFHGVLLEALGYLVRCDGVRREDIFSLQNALGSARGAERDAKKKARNTE